MGFYSNLHVILSDLTKANFETGKIYSGENDRRQPVHTLYGGAHLFKSSTLKKMNSLALSSFLHYIKNKNELSTIFNWDTDEKLNEELYNKILTKLKNEAIEDFRIDFEDGLGIVSEQEENELASFTAKEYSQCIRENSSPSFFGIRIKSFSEEAKLRAVKTLDIFLKTLLYKNDGSIPDNFIITLPKVTSADQISTFKDILFEYERGFGLSDNTLKFEIMLETPQAFISPEGNINLLNLINASENRCIGVHLGLYDLTSALNISPVYQTFNHQLCDFARYIVKFALAETGVNISDGATILIPTDLYRGDKLTEQQIFENKKAVTKTWKIIYDNVCHSLKFGIYQGWDLHPAQIPARYAAVYKFFNEGYKEVSERLRNFMDKAARATLTGIVFDDAATAQGMMNFLLRAYNCGAIGINEIEKAGLTIEQLKSKSFKKIVSDKKLK